CMPNSEGGSFDHTVSFFNNLALPASGKLLSITSNTGFAHTVYTVAEHNTAFAASGGPVNILGLTVEAKPGVVLSFKSNLFTKLSAAAGDSYAIQNQDLTPV